MFKMKTTNPALVMKLIILSHSSTQIERKTTINKISEINNKGQRSIKIIFVSNRNPKNKISETTSPSSLKKLSFENLKIK